MTFYLTLVKDSHGQKLEMEIPQRPEIKWVSKIWGVKFT